MKSPGRPKKLPDLATYQGRTGLRLTGLRVEAGLSVPELRDRLELVGHKVATRTIYQWERGERSVSTAFALPLAQALGVGPRDLLAPA